MDQMIRLGFAVLGVGIAALLLPGAQVFALAGLVLVGLGCAPIYPASSTPPRRISAHRILRPSSVSK